MVFASSSGQFYLDVTNTYHLSGLSHLDNFIVTRKSCPLIGPDSYRDLQKPRHRLTQTATHTTGPIILDEIGPLELNGQGWSGAIENITRSIIVPQLWVVRKSIVKKITRKWNIGNAYIFDITESSILEVKNKLNEIMFQKQLMNENK